MFRTLVLAGAMLAIAVPAAAQESPSKLTVAQPRAPLQKATKKPVRLMTARQAVKPLQRNLGSFQPRLINKADLARLIQDGKTLQPFKPGVTRPAVKPGKNALVIILENGGVMNNVDPALRRALDIDVDVLTCDDFSFEVEDGMGPVELIAEVGSAIGGALQCLDPRNWRRSSVNVGNWLNDQTDAALEEAVKGQRSLVNTQSYYDRVVVLEDADAVPESVIATMRSLAPNYVIDVHVLTHGDTNRFVGHRGVSFNAANFFNPLKADVDAGKLYLRAVYQMNCVSGTLKDEWQSLGAIAVNGTRGSNLNNMPHQYLHFMYLWLQSPPGLAGLEDASRRSFQDAAAYSRPIYSLVGMGNLIDVSEMTSSGSVPNARVTEAR